MPDSNPGSVPQLFYTRLNLVNLDACRLQNDDIALFCLDICANSSSTTPAKRPRGNVRYGMAGHAPHYQFRAPQCHIFQAFARRATALHFRRLHRVPPRIVVMICHPPAPLQQLRHDFFCQMFVLRRILAIFSSRSSSVTLQDGKPFIHILQVFQLFFDTSSVEASTLKLSRRCLFWGHFSIELWTR